MNVYISKKKVPYILFGNLLALILVLIGTNGVLKLIKFRIAVHGLVIRFNLNFFFFFSTQLFSFINYII